MEHRKCGCNCKNSDIEHNLERTGHGNIVIECRNECEIKHYTFQHSKEEEQHTIEKVEHAENTSMFIWSLSKQTNRDVNRFQYVTFENPPIGPINSGWSVYTQPTYQYPTNFIVQISGWYTIAYKLDAIAEKCSSECAVVLSRNGSDIFGSLTKLTLTEPNISYSNTNTVLVELAKGDSIALLFWSNNHTTQIGKTHCMKAIMPNGTFPKETTASLLITKIKI
jgi:hypothetical protein